MNVRPDPIDIDMVLDAANAEPGAHLGDDYIEYAGREGIRDLFRRFGFERMREICADEINRLAGGRK